MKLSYSYPMADPKKWLKFLNPWQSGIHPILAFRLAALARDIIKGILIFNSGHREIKEQERIWCNNGGTIRLDGSYFWPKSAGPQKVAKPGKSKHNYRIAVDTVDRILKGMDNGSTRVQKTLLKYGLFKPMAAGNKAKDSNGLLVVEDWHIQPIETNGVFDVNVLRQYADEAEMLLGLKGVPVLRQNDNGELTMYLQVLLSVKGYDCGTADGYFGPKTLKAVVDFQTYRKLKPDGVVGPLTWNKLQ